MKVTKQIDVLGFTALFDQDHLLSGDSHIYGKKLHFWWATLAIQVNYMIM